MESEITLPESEFFAENTKITIIPNFRHPGFNILSGTYGPIKPASALEVPLWLGIFLKRQQKCKIIPPAWMDLQVLKDKFEEERKEEGFAELDFYYMEISSLLLTHAKDDIASHVLVCRLIEDLHNLRSAKVRNKLQDLSHGSLYNKLTNLASIELQSIRRILPATYDSLYQINNPDVLLDQGKGVI
jgi:GINS complex subunit 2